MANIAAIDIGTNSTRILIAEEKNPLCPIFRAIEVTRLGEGVNQNRILQPLAMERTVEALKKFQGKAEDLKVKSLRLVATSAVRDAKNRQDFVDLVAQKTGLNLEVISGEEEAKLTYWGVTADLDWPEGNVVAFDLGGGSTELILGSKEEVKKLTSVDVGAVRMTEVFLHSNPVQDEEYKKMEEYLLEMLFPVLKELREEKVALLVGVGGTATSLAAMDQELVPYDPNRVHGYFVCLEGLKLIAEKLKKLTIEERQTIPGLHPKRADIILGGIGIVETLLAGLALDRFMVSENDLLLGMILQQTR